MNIDIGKTIRMSDFIDSKDGRSILVDTSIASCVGATDGLENLTEALTHMNERVDGIIVNPGQAEHQAEHLGGKSRAAPIVRIDWTNGYRSDDFCLPVSHVKWLMISSGTDAVKIGASAVAASLMLGFDDDFEANNIKDLSLRARECQTISLPVIIDIRPIGEKVTENNYEESITLGVSFMQELGADVLIIPDCSPKTYRMIGDWISVPLLLRLDEIPPLKKVTGFFESGLAGIVLTEKIFMMTKLNEALQKLELLIHAYRSG